MPNGQGTIDDKVKAGTPKAGSIFDSIGNSIDSLVKSVKTIPSLIKDTAYYTYYTAKPLAALTGVYLTCGVKTLIHAGVMAGGFVAGKLLGKLKNKEKIFAKETYKEISNEGTVGTVMGAFLSYVFKGAYYIADIMSNIYGKVAGIATKAVASLISMPAFMISHEYVNRALISDYKPQPWKERKKQMLKTAAILGLPVMANFVFIPPAYNIPAAAGINTAYGFLRAEPKKEEKKEAAPSPYASPPGYAMPKGA